MALKFGFLLTWLLDFGDASVLSRFFVLLLVLFSFLFGDSPVECWTRDRPWDI